MGGEDDEMRRRIDEVGGFVGLGYRGRWDRADFPSHHMTYDMYTGLINQTMNQQNNYLQQRPRERVGEEDGPVPVRLEVDACVLVDLVNWLLVVVGERIEPVRAWCVYTEEGD